MSTRTARASPWRRHHSPRRERRHEESCFEASIRLNPTRRTPVWVLLLLATLLPATQAHAQLPSGGGVEPVVVDSVDVEGNIRQADLTIIDMGGLSPRLRLYHLRHPAGDQGDVGDRAL